ncbi:MAG: hypothetical protein KBC87_03055, partial [Candidatus Pacebacteria bacterium]|nr:hypothetical protein [Candidatus Paceibacterota bacterium]
MENKNKILHVDGDNFFVACELARFPHLKGKPVIVGEERGIASAMSYEAKKLGVHRGMPVFEIRKQFPQVTILPAHFELYEQYALKLYQVLCKYSDTVERYSIDECFALIDETDIADARSQKHGEAQSSLLEAIKRDAETCLGITLSFGLADTKTLAKIGSKYNKPSGCVTISEQDRLTFLKETSIGSIWGIGRAISASLTSYNIKTAYDFILLDLSFIKKNFGEGTLTTWHELKGERRLTLETESHVPKSIQSTRSFGKSFDIFCTTVGCTECQCSSEPSSSLFNFIINKDPRHAKERSFFLSELSNHAESLCARLRSHKLTANKLSFFLKKNTLTDKYISREIEIGFYTNNASDICKAINKACKKIFDEIDDGVYSNQNFGFKIKATGISIYQLKPVEAVQDDLFAMQSTLDSKGQYTEVIDSLRRSVGTDSIYLCSSLESKK